MLGTELDETEASILAERMGLVRLTNGELLVSEDAQRRTLFLLAEGRLCVCKMVGGVEELTALLRHRTPDIVLLDIRLPDQDGLSIARRLRCARIPTRRSRRPEAGCARSCLPRRGSRSASRPPDWRANPDTMLSPCPLPLPGALVVKKGSHTRSRTSAGMPRPVSSTATSTVSSPAAAVVTLIRPPPSKASGR